MLVALPIERGNHVLVELGAFLEHSLRRVRRGVLEAGQIGDGTKTCEMFEIEHHVLDRGGIAHTSLQLG